MSLRPIVVVPTSLDERKPSERKLERREMYELLGQMIVDKFFWGERPLRELMAEEEIEGGALRAVHELRYMTHTLSEAGVVGKVTPPHFAHHQVGIPIHIMREYLRQEQPSCEWWIVAFQIEMRDLRRTYEYWNDHVVDARALERQASGGRVFGEGSPSVSADQFKDWDPEQPTQPVAASPHARIGEETDYQVVVHLAWADVRRSKLTDSVTHLNQRYGGRDADVSFMRDYAKTQNLDFLSEGARRNREFAKAVMRIFADEQHKLQAEATRIGATDDPPAAQVITPRAPRAARAAQGELDDAKRQRILHLRSQGQTPAAIAKAVRVKTDKVLEVLSAAASSQD